MSWTHHLRELRCDVSNCFYRHYPSYISGELNISELARVCNMSRTRVYRYIKVLK